MDTRRMSFIFCISNAIFEKKEKGVDNMWNNDYLLEEEKEPTWSELMDILDEMCCNMSEDEIEDWLEGE